MRKRFSCGVSLALAAALLLSPAPVWADDAETLVPEEMAVTAGVEADVTEEVASESVDATEEAATEVAEALPEEPELSPAAIYTPAQTVDLALGANADAQLTGVNELTEYRFTLDHTTVVRVNLSWEPSAQDATIRVWDLDVGSYSDYNIKKEATTSGTHQLSKTLEAGTHAFAIAGSGVDVRVALEDTSSYVTAISVPDVFVPAGDTATIAANLTPAKPTASQLTYVSADPSIAKVSATGVITGVKAGATTITVTDAISGVSTQVPVQVTVEVLDATTQDREATIQLGKTYSGVVGGYNDVTYRFTLPIATKVKLNLAWGEGASSYSSEMLFWGFDEEHGYRYDSLAHYSSHAYTLTETLPAGKHFVTVSGYGTTPFELLLEDQNTYASSIAVPDITVGIGGSGTLKVTPTPSSVDGMRATATVADASIATVKGLAVTGVKEGTTTVTVTDAFGGASTTATVTVTKAPIKRVGSSTAAVVLHKTKKLSVTSATPNPGVTWKSSNTKVAKVNASGVVTAVGAGSAKITATSKGANSVSWTVKVAKVKAKQVKVAKIKNQEYTAKAKKPVPAITFGGKKLKKGKDFTVKYAKNVNMGTATATITLKGNYTGKLAKKFKIVAPKVGKPKFTDWDTGYAYSYVEFKRGTNATGVQLRITGGGHAPFDKHIPGPEGWGESNKARDGITSKFMIRSYKKVGNKYFYSAWVTQIMY